MDKDQGISKEANYHLNFVKQDPELDQAPQLQFVEREFDNAPKHAVVVDGIDGT
jgi:hypothetical protein